jgi:hypothetical protein
MKSCKNLIGGMLCCLSTLSLPAATEYEVGPGKPIETPNHVPWESLEPGDTVSIFWRAEPYRAKWVICRRGTAEQPIRIRGIRGPGGELPVIDGRDAVMRPQLNYWGEARGIIKIGGANRPADVFPAHIILEDLEIRSARPPYTFTGRAGADRYARNAAAIFVEKGEHIVIRGCTLHDSGNGLMVASQTRDILIEKCWIYGNGNEGSIYEHNSYTAAAGIVFQFNRFGPLRKGCGGNNLKDRSAGLVVRYNWLEGGNRQLDLVDAEDTEVLRRDPRYRETFVYGNVLIEPGNDGNSQIVHYGGDSGKVDWYRKGTLYFYHNTVVSRRTGSTTLFRLSTNDEQVDCRNNIVYVTAPGRNLALLDSSGTVTLDHNWFSRGWMPSRSRLKGAVTGAENTLTGDSPSFVDERNDDFRLAPGSSCIGRATDLPPAISPPRMPAQQYVPHQSGRQRAAPLAGKSADLGAFSSD